MEKCLAPSILSADFGILKEQLELIDEAGAQYVHFDVMDGVFVPSISFGLPVLRTIRKYTDRLFDVHLMIVDPERYVKEFAGAGADIITVHAEACKHLDATIDLIKSCGVMAGVAINPATPLTEIMHVLEKVDMVLIMTVNPGFGGQSMIPYTLDKVRELSVLARQKKLKIDIEVDGGINNNTIDDVLDAGANIIVAGSAVFNGDVKANAERLLEKMQ
ncbi:ribulose-phosphate 3-epimerase [Pseudobutyrivibrio sp.]|uniref:ribulose-phosphate 3-epimerase n=1 Tax=Pseudobutyrivibrio sp. TaxID=2014367 RepID=UPI0025F5581D|nr:ribulose-phosphate 3-epimerase [Pseudobutyrivibrio sp.]MBR5649861.1 ribulose-phosphate 3-epimerase [Pseudobutyrivibrio sp.]